MPHQRHEPFDRGMFRIGQPQLQQLPARRVHYIESGEALNDHSNFPTQPLPTHRPVRRTTARSDRML
ncbi:hypothetical protein ACIRRA_08900 [Nocardia sp. NPDC101769]|uniref:hypothetical protein n=1 Tax=Nocardia sp. NPDC101769 TaxID=3364333 RepID=UPI00381D73DA